MQSPLDPGTLEQIRQLGGDKLLADLVEIFVEHAPHRLRDLRAGLAEGDLVRTAKAAHSFRSSSISLGATAVSDGAAALERLADRGEEEEVARKLSGFEDTLSALLAYLELEYGSRS